MRHRYLRLGGARNPHLLCKLRILRFVCPQLTAARNDLEQVLTARSKTG